MISVSEPSTLALLALAVGVTIAIKRRMGCTSARDVVGSATATWKITSNRHQTIVAIIARKMRTNEMGAFHSIDTRSCLDRFWSRMGFGQPHIAAPTEDELEGFSPRYMITDIVSRLDWRARIRALVSGNIMTKTITKTDVAVLRAHSVSKIAVLPPGRIPQ